MFAGQSKAMNKLAKEDKDFNFLLLYVREAHPGKLINTHNSIEQKCELASRLNKEDKIENRTIVIDDIDGTYPHFGNTRPLAPNLTLHCEIQNFLYLCINHKTK